MALRRRAWLAAAAVAAVLAGVWLGAAGPGGGRNAPGGGHSGAGGGGPASRATAAMPKAYRGLRNPLQATPETLAAGERLYMRDCSFCHGASGRGDGPAAAGLAPRPSDLAGFHARSLDDAAFFWRVSDGVPGTAMPAWGATLSPEQRWQVIAFVRHAFQRP
jgi:mono/diheme cytochrome c family protein